MNRLALVLRLAPWLALSTGGEILRDATGREAPCSPPPPADWARIVADEPNGG